MLLPTHHDLFTDTDESEAVLSEVAGLLASNAEQHAKNVFLMLHSPMLSFLLLGYRLLMR
eukprot:scaffold583997_cov16-Prasinocladus_malaysianus.AAC.1